jgi:hypothetical protein
MRGVNAPVCFTDSREGEADRGDDSKLRGVELRVAITDGDDGGSGDRVK